MKSYDREDCRGMQRFLNAQGARLDADGIYGALTEAAGNTFFTGGEFPPIEVCGDVHYVKASSFADPADVAAFKRCKAQGKSDQECFKVGDNGIGKWGDDTTTDTPMCALPPEDWEHLDNPRGALVLVNYIGREVVCELRDTMPHKHNITNGAGIDLNPAACAELGLKPPMMVDATWQWVKP